MTASLPVTALDYVLDEDLIAVEPAQPRDTARMMVVHRDTGDVEHRVVRDLPEYLTATAVSVAAAAFVPSDDRLMMLLGGVGNSLFFLAPMMLLLAWPTKAANLLAGNPSFAPQTRLIVLALVTTLLYVFVVAPGIKIG